MNDQERQQQIEKMVKEFNDQIHELLLELTLQKEVNALLRRKIELIELLETEKQRLNVLDAGKLRLVK